MSASVSSRHCMLAWSILLLLLLFVAGAVLLPWWNQMTDLEVGTSRNLDLLHKHQSLLADRPALEARLNDPRSQARMNSDYLKGRTGALAAAELQQQIKGIVGTARGQLVSTQTLPVEESSPTSKITVRVRMRTDTDAMLKVLHSLESGKPLLFVENLTIRRYQRRRKQQGNQLDVNFDLSGYMRQVGE